MQVRCPICKKKTTWEENPYKPFCSERCKMIDLGKWASDEYKVPGEDTENDKKKTE
ncbi:MAG: DNA gyrase inhibitor YacG [Dissulfurispiraceae bacterium]